MYVIFLIWQYLDIQVIAIHAFPKKHGYQNVGF